MAEINPAIAAVLAKQFEPARYPFPYPLADGGETQIAVRLLSDHEIDLSRLEAQRYCGRMKADLSLDPDLLEREVQRQLVWRAILEPFPEKETSKHVPLFPSDADVRALPSTVVEALTRLYLEHQDRTSPMRVLEDPDAFVAALRAKDGPKALSALDHGSLVKVAVALASMVP